jgi:hypothetical protein
MKKFYVIVTTVYTGDGASSYVGKGFRKESDALMHLQNLRDQYFNDNNKHGVELYDNVEPRLYYSEDLCDYDVKIREVEVQ